MDNDLRIVRAVWKWVRAVLGILSGVFPVIASTSALITGLKVHDVILVGLWALLLGSACMWVILLIGDRIIAGFERFREGRRVATLLREWRGVGNPAIRVDALVALWLEKAPDNKVIRQMKEQTLLRTLKAAVRQGLIQRQVKDESEVNATTLCDVDSAAEFFAKAKWISVNTGPSGPDATQIPAGVTVAAPPRRRTLRSNWIMAHRDPGEPWM